VAQKWGFRKRTVARSPRRTAFVRLAGSSVAIFSSARASPLHDLNSTPMNIESTFSQGSQARPGVRFTMRVLNQYQRALFVTRRSSTPACR
jgi:hypothetical protein